jgi:hypothetical protein
MGKWKNYLKMRHTHKKKRLHDNDDGKIDLVYQEDNEDDS